LALSYGAAAGSGAPNRGTLEGGNDKLNSFNMPKNKMLCRTVFVLPGFVSWESKNAENIKNEQYEERNEKQ
jgi:hypothetical protein